MKSKVYREWFYFFLLLAFAPLYAQTERFIPDSAAAVGLWHISDSTKLYVGASFYYKNPLDSIIVWLDSSDADTSGTLYFMVPGYKDSALALFTNRQKSRFNITKMLQKPVPMGTEIFFKYQSAARKYPRYTGQNRTGIDPLNQTAYPGARFVSRDFGLRPGFGHRFAVAGRLDARVGSINDTVVFGFEDGGDTIIPGHDSLVVTDFDFNDVIFKSTGLELNVEVIPDSIAVVCPDTARAGDSVVCKAEVWSDSDGTKIRSPQLDSLVTWTLAARGVLGDTLVRPAGGLNGTALLLPRTAYEKLTVCAKLPFGATRDTLRSCKNVWVNPGPPKYLSIELRSDSAAPGFSLHAAVQIERVQLASNSLSLSLYAVLRDRFENFAGFSSSAVWDTSSRSLLADVKAGVATVKPGNSVKGEAVVEKGVGSGSELVFARTVAGAEILSDTVIINVATTDYDSIRVCAEVNKALIPVNMCAITMDQCTTLVSTGRRVDNGLWERIATQWQPRPWFPIATTALDTLRFCPLDTGKGNLAISFQNRLNRAIPLIVTPGSPKRMVLFTETGAPFPTDTFAVAGAALKLFARIFDGSGIWLKTISAASITWTATEGAAIAAPADSTGRLDISSGNPAVFYPLRARRSVAIRAAYLDLSDTLAVSVLPGKPYRLSIESTADWMLSPYAPAEIDTVKISDDRISAVVWALVRDSLGNFVDSLRSGIWGSGDTIVSVRPGTLAGQGLIIKNLLISQGTCLIFASQPSGGLSDTAFVTLLPFHYNAIRIVAGNGVPIDSLVMTTNDDTLLRVQALRSDTAIWCDVAALWRASDGVAAPVSSSMFRYSPVVPGRGSITSELAGKQTLFDTVKTIIERGPPVRAEFTLLTPDDARIAGDTILAMVKIYNKDGLVPGVFCYGKSAPLPPAYYQDSLGYGNGLFLPKVLSGEAEATITDAPSVGPALSQCFTNGSDTVGFVLFYAPFARDSLHRMVVKLGDLSANCAPFRLKPSILASLKLPHSNYCCRDTLVLRYPKESAIVYAVGYDRFGNIRGEENSVWKTTGSLHPIGVAAHVSRIVYSADSQIVKHDEEGAIVATAAGDTMISGSLWTFLVGPQAAAVSALTKDDNGDGLLDRVAVRFSKSVYQRDLSLSSRFSVTYHGTALEIDSVVVAADSLIVDLYLKEKAGSPLQTDWTPDIALHNGGFALGGAADSFSLRASDGAGPVIESVVKEIKGGGSRNDLVTVVFSEPVVDKSGNTISFLCAPEGLFCTWLQTPAGGFDKVTMLEGIGALNAPTEPTNVKFTTSNGKELISSHFFTLRTDPSAITFFDKSGNRPSTLNRKVRVVIKGEPPPDLVIAPNPGIPTPVRERPGEFHFSHNPSALQWVAADQAGFVLKFQILIAQAAQPQVSGRCKIYDIVGNAVNGDPIAYYQFKNIIKGGRVLVNQNYSDILPSTWTPNGTVYDYMVYWNGYMKNGLKAAPGAYKAIITLLIENGGRKEQKTFSGTLGIKR